MRWDGKVTYLPIYMWYLVKEQSIAQLIVDLDTIENNLDLNSLKLQQVGAEISENQKLQQPVARIRVSNNIWICSVGASCGNSNKM